ncbi:hypothetical protein AB0F25_30350 [Streptomyces wedmorensis]|uniref:hypothetical protein n=1 Tax=Streptomyces wedmorensis TaxID=43759 RepID=UPI003444E27C
MAGRTRRGSRNPEAQTDNQVDETPEVEATDEDTTEGATEAPETSQEAPVSATTEEAPVQDEAQAEAPTTESTESTETPTETPAAQVPAQATPKSADDLYADFQTAVTGAVERSDPQTGAVPEKDMADLLAAYKLLASTGRNSKSDGKTWIAEVMRKTLVDGNMPGATAYANINKAVNEASSRRTTTAAPKPTVSPTEAYVARYVSQALAAQFIPVPEGLDDNWQQQYNEVMDRESKGVEAYKAWLAKPEAERGDEPEGLSQILKDAAKLGQGRAVGRKASGTRRTGGSTGGTRRDVKKHIEEFLESVESGTEHAVAAIAHFKSSEYPDGDASPGAVAARLFPTGGKDSNIQGFESVTDDGPRRIRKV